VKTASGKSEYLVNQELRSTPVLHFYSLSILSHKIYRYFKVGYLLHLISLLGVVMAIFFLKFTKVAILNNQLPQQLLYGYLAAYGAVLPIFAQLDARSRYQNYKLIKDKLHRYGFSARIIDPFTWSRCQRDAIQVAANDLGYKKQMQDYFKKLGFKWYHVLPRILIRNPRLLFTKSYWFRTLFVKYYALKNFPY
jgi:hypothetical protein